MNLWLKKEAGELEGSTQESNWDVRSDGRVQWGDSQANGGKEVGQRNFCRVKW